MRTFVQEARVDLFGRELHSHQKSGLPRGTKSPLVLLTKTFCRNVPKGTDSAPRKRPRWNRSRAACNCASESEPRC